MNGWLYMLDAFDIVWPPDGGGILRTGHDHARVAVAPGTGFGHYGDGHVRFAMIENEARTRQAIRGIREMFRKDGLL